MVAGEVSKELAGAVALDVEGLSVGGGATVVAIRLNDAPIGDVITALLDSATCTFGAGACSVADDGAPCAVAETAIGAGDGSAD